MNRPEQQLQQACVKWFALQYPQHKGRLFAINNNSKSARMGAINKSMGVVAGVADMCLLTIDWVIFIEVKTGKGRQSEAQKVWEDIVNASRFSVSYDIVRSLDEFMDLVNSNMR